MNVLSIGGSDPSSGAGIQSDVKTFENHDVYGFTVITAITSQNTKKISKIAPISAKDIRTQLESVLSDFQIDAIKIGMVYDSSIIKIVNTMIKNQKCPIVVDPIIESTTKKILLKKSAIDSYKKYIIPLATIITHYILKGKKIKIINHGSGCNYSASITASLARKKSIYEATVTAKEYVYQSIKKSKNLGKGIKITHKEISKIQKELSHSILDFQNIKNVSNLIPECQTNFVFSKNKPKTIKNVLGISGRLVKSGNNVIQAGELVFGGSQHVATAVIQVSKKFSNIRSAINIKYEPKIISNAKKHKMLVLSYDRKNESKKSKSKENSSISWGISSCLKSDIPDIIYHKGDFGKEAMIIVFGETPAEVVRKIKLIQ